MSKQLRLLPSMSQVLARRGVRALLRQWRHDIVRDVARTVLADLREDLRRDRSIAELAEGQTVDSSRLLRVVEARLGRRLAELERPQLRRVVNATGVLLHTNLGRARLSAQAADEIARVAVHPVALEVDLQTGRRGRRTSRVAELLRLLTGAEAAAVANNGAAALWLTVRALAPRSRKILVARGEQVAIGGSFRMPELVRTTGARMVDVGTTNRTTLEDYAAELEEGDLVLKVHPSNYRIAGFHEETSLSDLADLVRRRGARLIYDAGSGSLLDFSRFGLRGEETVRSSLAAGAHVVTFSGDKLLGGPQAGLIVGSADEVARISRHPLMRALRCDKMILAGLERTLLDYARCPAKKLPELPLLEALKRPLSELKGWARELVDGVNGSCPEGWSVGARRSRSAVGGGSFAEEGLPSWELCIEAPDERAAHRLHQALRRGDPAVYTRIDDRSVACDLRSVHREEIDLLRTRLKQVLESSKPSPRPSEMS
jgi:L-seryl-tRNA(Ser) seleniumtransferase